MADIPIPGVVYDFRVPGPYADIEFAQGPASAASKARDVVLAMPMLSTGSWTAATLYEIDKEQDAIDGASAGSPLHRAARKFLQCNKVNKLYGLPVAETSGGTPVAGTFGVTWTSDPNAAGKTWVKVCDETCEYSFDDGTTDTVTTIAAAIAATINEKTWLPVTASSAAGVLTITAKLKGISQGNGTLDVIQVRTYIDPNCNTTVSAAGAVGDTVAGAEGSTTEAANLATALATLDARRIYFVVSSANDSTSYDNLCTHINNKSVPKKGYRSIGIAAYTGALAGLQTIAKGDNNPRFQIVWQENSDHDMAEIAANMAAIRAYYESSDSAYNFAGYPTGDEDVSWRINKQHLDADFPTTDDQNDAINDGVTSIASNDSGSWVVMSVNTRSKTAAAGSINDFRATETHRVSVADDFTDVALTKWSQMRAASPKLKDDAKLSDGTVDPNQKLFKKVMLPSMAKDMLKQTLHDFEFDAPHRLQESASSISALRVILPDNNSSRVASAVNLHAIDHANQFTMLVSEVSD